MNTTVTKTSGRLSAALPRALALATLMSLGLMAGCAGTARSESTGEYIDDTVITTRVKSALVNEPTLKSSEINVETFKGRVQLSGFVGSQADIDRAVALTRGVTGVTTVSNVMRLK
jgi:osmotically-inducible protein OsmY